MKNKNNYSANPVIADQFKINLPESLDGAINQHDIFQIIDAMTRINGRKPRNRDIAMKAIGLANSRTINKIAR